MLDLIYQLSAYLDNLTGIKGILGHICIVAIIMVGHAWANAQPTPHATGADKEEEDEQEPPRNFTLSQLAHFDGKKDKDGDDKAVYLALNGIVFDVSEGRNFYGPGGPYELFAGHECGVALAKMSFDAEFLDDFDSISKLRHGETMELEGWIDKFTHYRCYPVLGRVIPVLPDTNRILSKSDLAKCTGSTSDKLPDGYASPPIYVGAGNKVFDVSFGGITFYGPGCSYHRFAGKDASRALAKMSFEEADILSNDVSDLEEKQLKILNDWIKTFEGRKSYPIVGRLGKE